MIFFTFFAKYFCTCLHKIIFFDILLSILYLIYARLTCSTCFHPFFCFTYYVYCYAPTHQDKFLVCENLPGNNSDPDPCLGHYTEVTWGEAADKHVDKLSNKKKKRILTETKYDPAKSRMIPEEVHIPMWPMKGSTHLQDAPRTQQHIDTWVNSRTIIVNRYYAVHLVMAFIKKKTDNMRFNQRPTWICFMSSGIS